MELFHWHSVGSINSCGIDYFWKGSFCSNILHSAVTKIKSHVHSVEAQKEWWQISMLDPKELSGVDALWPGPQRLDRITAGREVLYNPQSWIPVTSFLLFTIKAPSLTTYMPLDFNFLTCKPVVIIIYGMLERTSCGVQIDLNPRPAK